MENYIRLKRYIRDQQHQAVMGFDEICLWRFANINGADQTVRMHSAFAIRLLESIISRLATGEISIF